MFGRISLEAVWSWTSVWLHILITGSVLLLVVQLFRLFFLPHSVLECCLLVEIILVKIFTVHLFLSPSSVSILITNALNSLSGKLFIFVSLVVLSRVFSLVLSFLKKFLSFCFA